MPFTVLYKDELAVYTFDYSLIIKTNKTNMKRPFFRKTRNGKLK